MSATIIAFPGPVVALAAHREQRRCPMNLPLDLDLETERDRLTGKRCEHRNGQRGYVDAVVRFNGIIIARFWADGKDELLQSSLLQPIGPGRPAA